MTPTTPINSITLQAFLLGKAKTSGDTLQVTLKISQDILTLYLKPEDASIFPNLNTLEGGGHPLYDPTRVTYNHNVPLYKVVISPIAPEPLPVESFATPQSEQPISVAAQKAE